MQGDTVHSRDGLSTQLGSRVRAVREAASRHRTLRDRLVGEAEARRSEIQSLTVKAGQLAKVGELFRESALLLAQEFLYTEFDWRIGVFNNKALFACRYFMVKNHWQIYRHGGNRIDSGNFDTLPTFEVPKSVLEAALKATQPIGNGLYGVDVKEIDGKGYVIEVNDNPNIDSGIEDKYLGEDLYRLIIAEFLRRMENRSKGLSE